VDSGVYTGYVIPPYYDSLISKLVAHGKDRKEAIARMERALYEYIIVGVKRTSYFTRLCSGMPGSEAVTSIPAS